MDTLDKVSRLIEALSLKKGADKTTAFKKIVTFFVSGTSWSAVVKELSALGKGDVTADKFGLSSDEFADLKKKTGKAKDYNFGISVFQKSIIKKLGVVLNEVGKDVPDNRFEEVILPLLILAADMPLKYLPENDPFGARVNYSAKDIFKKDKSFLYAPASYKSLSLEPSSLNLITRPFIIPILQFVIKSDRYITSDRMGDIPFIAQCLRFAVHFEDPNLEALRSSFWELAVKVIKAVHFNKTNESVAIFDQLSALTWFDNEELCTKAVWRSSGSSPTKSLVMSKEEMYAHIALLRSMGRKVSVNVHIKSCLRDVIKSMMKSICYRKEPNDCLVLLKLMDSWMRKGKEGPLDIQLVRLMIRDVMEAYDSFLAKCPKEPIGENTEYILRLGHDALAVNSNLKSVKSSLENIFDRMNNTISKSGQESKSWLSQYIGLMVQCLDESQDSSLGTKEKPWYILFRALFLRCGVLKMKMEWMDKSDVIRPLLMKIADLLMNITEKLKENSSCDYLNECIPILTEAVYLLVSIKMDKEKKWDGVLSLCDSKIPSSICTSISYMKNQSAKTQCSSFISKMVDPLTVLIDAHPPKTTFPHFESFFTVALTTDLPTEIREAICHLWKDWYGLRINELSGVSISDELMDRLKWFDLPIPPNTINEKLEVKVESNGGSPNKSVLTTALKSAKKESLFCSPVPMKKMKNANDALKMIDLMDEDSVQFYPVEESPKKKQRMTEKQKEMMMEKRDRIPFIEDESRSGMPKIPSDMFELSISGMDGSSKGGSRRAVNTDFSHLTVQKKSESIDGMKELKKKQEEKKESDKGEENSQIHIKNITVLDSNIDESYTESMSEETEEDEKEEREKRGRRKSKTPMKMIMKTREVRSPSRKKLESTMAMDSPKRKKRAEKFEKKEDKKNLERKEEEHTMEIEKTKGEILIVEENEIVSLETRKREDKITISPIKNEENMEDEKVICESNVVLTDNTPPSSQSINNDSSPIKPLELEGDVSAPRTPANRGAFEPVGILSSSKKNKSERKKGGVHFNVSDEVKKIDEIDEEVEEKLEKDEEDGDKEEKSGGKEEKNDAIVFPLLRENCDSIDTIILRLGQNSRMIKMSLDKIGVKRIGQLASLGAREINGIMGIKPPKMRTVESVLEGVFARSQKPDSKLLSPICTPEKNDVTVGDEPLPPIELSPVSRRISPSKPKSRKRLALSDSPIRMKKAKIEEEEKEKKEGEEKEKEEIMEVTEEKKKEEIVMMDNEEGNDRSDEMENSDENVDEGKENINKEENDEKEGDKCPIASVQDVISFISHLKGVSLQSLLSAHDEISRSFIEAIKEVTTSKN